MLLLGESLHIVSLKPNKDLADYHNRVYMKKTNKYLSIILFGSMLAGLLVFLKFFQYRYYIGSLDTDIYTSLVAIIFTTIGIWIGINLLKPKKVPNQVSTNIDYSKIKELNLREREYEILQLVSKGLSNQEIANELFIALPTVKTHTSNLYSKLEVKKSDPGYSQSPILAFDLAIPPT